jgi:hypothetical protein
LARNWRAPRSVTSGARLTIMGRMPDNRTLDWPNSRADTTESGELEFRVQVSPAPDDVWRNVFASLAERVSSFDQLDTARGQDWTIDPKVAGTWIRVRGVTGANLGAARGALVEIFLEANREAERVRNRTAAEARGRENAGERLRSEADALTRRLREEN